MPADPQVVGRERLRTCRWARAGSASSIRSGAGGTTSLALGGPGQDVVYTTASRVGLFRLPVGVRGFLHPGAPRYTLLRMLDLTPADAPVH